MGSKIQFTNSAFKHGCTTSNIQKAIETKIFEGPLEQFSNKYAIIGFDAVGNLL